MKIGIFGDSFASLKFVENTTPTWVDILSTKYDVTNHAFPGSNLFYSIKLIHKTHLDYNKIILVVTEPGRLQLPEWLSLSGPEQFVIGSLDNKIINKNDVDEYKRVIYEVASQYFIYLQNIDYDSHVHNLMLMNIVKTKHDIILIPAFSSSFAETTASMHQIFEKENDGWNIDNSREFRSKFYDVRNCHMTAENNAIFATKVEKWLHDEPVHINLDDFVTTTNKDFYLRQL